MSPAALPTPRDLLDVARQINRATVILPGLPARPVEEFATTDQVRARLRQLAAGRPLTFRAGVSAYPLDDAGPPAAFPSLTVYAGSDWIATYADRWLDAQDVAAARRMLEAA